MLTTLSEIFKGLCCYNVLSLIRANSDIVFCPGRVFNWTYEMFQKLIKKYSVKMAPAKETQKCVSINIVLAWYNAFSWMVRFSSFSLSPKTCS